MASVKAKKKYCSVGGCKATNETHDLYCYPRNDRRRELWLSFITPTNPFLRKISKYQLFRKRVCERHFDSTQFVEGRKLRFAYPCLITETEIALGIPVRKPGSTSNDHNYSLKLLEEDQSDSIANTGSIHNDHNYSLELLEEDSMTDDARDPLELKVETDPLELKDEEKYKIDIKPDIALEEPASVNKIQSKRKTILIKEGAKINSQSFDGAAPQTVEHGHRHSNNETSTKNRDTDLLAQAWRTTMGCDDPIEQEYSVVESTQNEDDGTFDADVPPAEPLCSRTDTFQSNVKKKAEKHAVVTPASSLKNIRSKKRKFTNEVIETATESLCETSKTPEPASSVSNNQKLFNQFNSLNKEAQTFLMMQLKQAKTKKMGRRFTIEEKLLASLLRKQSPQGYKLLQEMFTLPNKRTLNRLSQKMSMEPGLDQQVFQNIANKTKDWKTNQKCCTIVFDEVSLASQEKSDAAQRLFDIPGQSESSDCDRALVFMVRGICSPWRQSVAYYKTAGPVSAPELLGTLTELVQRVAATGLLPLGLVCNQDSSLWVTLRTFRQDTSNARKLDGIPDDGSVHVAGYDLSIFFDPPHLLKSFRNEFLTKDVIWEGKIASWKDIEFVYDLDSKLGPTRTLSKLTTDDVHRQLIDRTRVSSAAKALSAKTAAMLKYTHVLNTVHRAAVSESTMGTTAVLVEFVDKLFDSVNGYPTGGKQGKLRGAVKRKSRHHAFWADAFKTLKTLSFVDKSGECDTPRPPRAPCLLGWMITLQSFMRISTVLFEKHNVALFYPRYINQDPLANFFGQNKQLNPIVGQVKAKA